MRRLFAIAVLIVFTAPSAYAAEASADCRRGLDFSLSGGFPQLLQVGTDKISFGEAVMLKWPAKKVSLDAKNAGIARLAELMTAQTGIQFTLSEGVPKGLKITVHVSGMGIKEFLDMLSAATGLTYVAEHREIENSAGDSEVERRSAELELLRERNSAEVAEQEGLLELAKMELALATEDLERKKGMAREGALSVSEVSQAEVAAAAKALAVEKIKAELELKRKEGVAKEKQQEALIRAGMGGLLTGLASRTTSARIEQRLVTHVTISSLREEGVIVNMGKASLSLKDADPVETVTKLIKQINGAGYVVIKLEDYLALQDPERAAEIEKAVERVDRPKISLALRDADIVDALARLAEKGHFYITVPKPGIPNFLIIPDVKVLDEKVLPPLDQLERENAGPRRATIRIIAPIP